ncbi:mannose-1-phosphate guanylyltransferase [Rufibacter quisquiliarum]|uniref:mannose-1-phosphate guanylyltransferase n=1 Tax=Rufibacter quisquiliarum TaxID=1549639 RepID=A0A839GRD9_9BACT|nr:mannose-1-phosphate guanylyltransferase [Rufibacter quisquiliarum]MBA9076968.1 mannose-1-phosphate guanylyltransferase [Rufibacter quisquiliarum]
MMSTQSENTFVVVMAGGIGSRFWPFSRNNHPKQFHDVLGIGESMIQTTVKRFDNICPPENVFVVTNREYADLVRQHLPQLQEDQILQEPVGRNTAPCIAYACYKIAQRNPNANIVVAPADHVILRQAAFEDCIQQALEATSRQDILVTLGIKPTRPDTGYGYIQYLENSSPLKKVKTFTEKPDLELAQSFLESGDFVWNAGIFIWNAQAILKAFRRHLEEIADLFEEGASTYYTSSEAPFIDNAYSQSRNISIDYGIMEKAENVYVILGDLGWSDLGTWNSLYSLAEKNEDGNVVDGNVLLYDTQNCIIKTPKDRLVVLQGLQDYIVAEYNNVLMVCHRNEEQKVKEFVADVKARKGTAFI